MRQKTKSRVVSWEGCPLWHQFFHVPSRTLIGAATAYLSPWLSFFPLSLYFSLSLSVANFIRNFLWVMTSQSSSQAGREGGRQLGVKPCLYVSVWWNIGRDLVTYSDTWSMNAPTNTSVVFHFPFFIIWLEVCFICIILPVKSVLIRKLTRVTGPVHQENPKNVP